MSAPFVTQLRAARPEMMLAPPGAESVTLRVESAELWNAIRVVAEPATPVIDVKARVIAEWYPDQQYPGDFVLKLRGWEILDERLPLSECGVVNGSILLLAYRRRRPVR